MSTSDCNFFQDIQTSGPFQASPAHFGSVGVVSVAGGVVVGSSVAAVLGTAT